MSQCLPDLVTPLRGVTNRHRAPRGAPARPAAQSAGEMRNTAVRCHEGKAVSRGQTADWVIDLGPEGGDRSGQVIAVGTPEAMAACPQSCTGQFLKGLLERGW